MANDGRNYELIRGHGGTPIKAWMKGVRSKTRRVSNCSTRAMPFIHKWIAAMPDVH